MIRTPNQPTIGHIQHNAASVAAHNLIHHSDAVVYVGETESIQVLTLRPTSGQPKRAPGKFTAMLFNFDTMQAYMAIIPAAQPMKVVLQ